MLAYPCSWRSLSSLLKQRFLGSQGPASSLRYKEGRQPRRPNGQCSHVLSLQRLHFFEFLASHLEVKGSLESQDSRSTAEVIGHRPEVAALLQEFKLQGEQKVHCLSLSPFPLLKDLVLHVIFMHQENQVQWLKVCLVSLAILDAIYKPKRSGSQAFKPNPRMFSACLFFQISFHSQTGVCNALQRSAKPTNCPPISV